MVTNFTKEQLLRDFSLKTEYRETYQALLRNLKRREGFGILFVLCSPAQRVEIIDSVQKDLPDKSVETLNLENNINNLYNLIAQKNNQKKIDILFITGIEKTLVDYIKSSGIGGQGDYYRLDTVPPILSHLNLQRERFRDDFKTCFVFFVPLFALKYILRRSPDFYDWRSGVFEFASTQERVKEESLRYLREGDYEQYLLWTPQQRREKILEIEDLISERYQTLENKAALWFEVGRIYAAEQNWEEAIQSYDKAIELQPDNYNALNLRGIALRELGRLEEAIVSFDQAIEIQSNDSVAWNNKGIVLHKLGRFDESIQSYKHALALKADDHNSWFFLGYALLDLGQFAEAAKSFDTALTLKPDNHDSWFFLGYSLSNLGRLEEAIQSFDTALALKPDDYAVWYFRGITLSNLGQFEEAIQSYDKVLKFKSEDANTYYNKACCYALQENIDQALSNLQQAIALDQQYQVMAKTDSDFDDIRSDQRFQNLINSP
ncbi:tetratricopeptide repeat protein [Chroococcus sp. FPU101]|uniref:tetratricopeptide repeat protein n=1 Tax=Chroococcus sp. FPU101 TaxID=1974212 RepID=UPI001A8FF4A4|nr:tetratricopeptide repeat protein [Chroococcus sp. FPU101]GFE68601.1 TPR repeat-containing protein [Chroococcus sp. FPU101]